MLLTSILVTNLYCGSLYLRAINVVPLFSTLFLLVVYDKS